MLTCESQALIAVATAMLDTGADSPAPEGPRHTVHDDRPGQSDFAWAARLMSEAVTEQRFPDRALSALVGGECRDMLLSRLRVVRESIAAGTPGHLRSADHLVASAIRDLGGAL